MPSMTRIAPFRRRALLVLAGLVLVACSKPEPPEKDRPPSPQATAITQAIQAPIEKAKSAETTVLDAGKQQAADIDAQTSGNASSETPPPAY
jgi:hypothetical protein